MRRNATWLSGLGALALIGTLVVANYGAGVPQAWAQTAPNALTVIIAKLNQILTALGGITEGNHTLRWDQNLPAAQRFVILPAFNNRAVLDKNTGLVWERQPETTSATWLTARLNCAMRSFEGTPKGWRLPSVIELQSVHDLSLPPPFVPASVFIDVQSTNYWSATTVATDPFSAFMVWFSTDQITSDSKGNSWPQWCVRGGMNADQY